MWKLGFYHKIFFLELETGWPMKFYGERESILSRESIKSTKVICKPCTQLFNPSAGMPFEWSEKNGANHPKLGFFPTAGTDKEFAPKPINPYLIKPSLVEAPALAQHGSAFHNYLFFIKPVGIGKVQKLANTLKEKG